jgi:ribonuclease HI
MIENNDTYKMYFDGCSKGNPGLAGAGAVIYKNDDEIWTQSKFIGKNETNNVAEYNGLIIGLEEAVHQNIKNLQVYGDSELVIKQMNNLYKVKAEKLLPLFNKAKKLQTNFNSIQFQHIYRKDNARADHLSNIALNLCF